MNGFRSLLRFIYRRSTTVRDLRFLIKFFKRNRYWPNFKNPKTYNEKINYRKRDPKNPLFSLCSDKIRAKEYVAEKISEDIIIPNYYVGDNISFEELKQILMQQGDCLLKANHNSGPVHLLTTSCSDEKIRTAIADTQRQLTIDYGNQKREPWYSAIKPGVLVEKRLQPEDGETDIRDYKFHTFKQADGSFRALCAIDFDRDTNHTRSFFDEEFNWLNVENYVPNIRTVVVRPKNYKKMLEIAKTLAEPFSYVRIDLYNVNGRIYFGEMTFAPGSGSLGSFQSKKYDLWMGSHWHCDSRY